MLDVEEKVTISWHHHLNLTKSICLTSKTNKFEHFTQATVRKLGDLTAGTNRLRV